MTSFNLYEAYAAVYNEDLREDVLTVEEDLSFIDDLSDNELVQVMEEILSEKELTLDECFDAFESELLSEAKVTTGAGYGRDGVEPRKVRTGSARVTVSKGDSDRRDRVSKKHAVKRLQVATSRAASNASRIASKAGDKVKGKLASAKDKIKGFVTRVGSAAKAGYKAAKKEFSGQASKEAKAKETGREMKRAARKQASAERGRDTSAFEKKKAPEGTSENPRIGQPAKERPALPAAKSESKPSRDRRAEIAARVKKNAEKMKSSGGVSYAGPSGVSAPATKKKDQKRLMGAAAKVKKEDFDALTYSIIEDLINEGYASDFDSACDFIIEMDNSDLGEIAESYLTEETEVLDLYDVVLEHLLDEGYADTEDAATVIMANMSEEWRDEIVELYGPSSAKDAANMSAATKPRTGLERGEIPPSYSEIMKRKRLEFKNNQTKQNK